MRTWMERQLGHFLEWLDRGNDESEEDGEEL